MADREAWYRTREDPLEELLSEIQRRAVGRREGLPPAAAGRPGGRAPRLSGRARGSRGTTGRLDVLGVPGAGSQRWRGQWRAGEPTVAGARNAGAGATGVGAGPAGAGLEEPTVVEPPASARSPGSRTPRRRCRRHLPPRHRRPLGQHGRGHAQRRLAAVQPRRSPSWASRSVLGSQMAWLDEGLPNSLTPGRRPRTTLTPSLALRDGVRRAAISRTSGSCTSSWPSPCARRYAAAWTSRAPSTPRTGTTTASPARSTRAGMRPGSVTVESRADREMVELCRRGHDVGAPGPRAGYARWRGPADRGAVGGGEPAGDAGLRGRALRPVPVSVPVPAPLFTWR